MKVDAEVTVTEDNKTKEGKQNQNLYWSNINLRIELKYLLS